MNKKRDKNISIFKFPVKDLEVMIKQKKSAKKLQLYINITKVVKKKH